MKLAGKKIELSAICDIGVSLEIKSELLAKF